jgi:hypothetical protein
MSELLAVLKGTDGTTLVPPERFRLGRIPWASIRLNWPAVVGDATRVNPSAISAGVVEGTGAAVVVAANADIANAVSPAHRIVIGVIVRCRLARPQSAPSHRRHLVPDVRWNALWTERHEPKGWRCANVPTTGSPAGRGNP